jgi:hypothetical protein
MRSLNNAMTRKRHKIVKPCSGCPFNDGLTEEATHVQNLGCLPTKWESIERLEEKGEALSCHLSKTDICEGLREARPELAKDAVVISYDEWYHNG